MKKFSFFVSLFFLASLIFFIITLSFDKPLFSKENDLNWLGIGASVCGFLTAFIIYKFQSANDNLEKNR
ncbi:F0F1-ATPase subunit (ATPase_gene1) [Candidatus Ornithobacterium hominis]|uniref:hypothetical protein n=1 Tax=Candidatus Ornithobacterium hominis TaxID=2497989 RepID=UPI0024BD46C4|nr:hypothetical protein [Candidatus Ornithobacterium hominis]CAI9428596.1 F0F1-ATPase subunit (ATPase_gene1) [Candidatus Ornithobacterium hominis]